MIIKGKSRAGPASLARHLGNAEKNERVELLETRGTVAADLHGALAEMAAVAVGTRCQKPLYHAAISPEPPHRLTDEQRTEAIDALERKLGLDGQPRVVMLHEKEGREHLHVVWSRIDIDRMRAIPDSHNYRKHEEASRELERRFGHDRVQGAHHERENAERPVRTPSRAELRQEERTGITGKKVRGEVTSLFRTSDSAQAFRAALEKQGYQLARGDRRDYVIVDSAGGIHSLARRIDGTNATALRAFMASLDRGKVPTIDELRAASEAGHDSDAMLAKAYARGGDYVSQSRAAQKDHESRMERLARTRAASDPDGPSESRSDDLPMRGDIEITDAMQTRLDRLREFKSVNAAGPPRDRQNEATGGGHTRSR
jgi:hypothetical protein